MASTVVTKVTSVGSHSGGMPTAPNTTPATEILDSAVIEPPPPIDFAAVTKTLAHMEDTLNEDAHEASLPDPPINTPVLGSPTPSMACRLPHRGRGFSVVGDRLAQLKIDDRNIRRQRTPSSFCSNSGDCDDCECEMASISEVMSDDCKDKGCRRQACSPTVNPRIEEFLSFTSKDLPTKAPAPASGTTLAEHASNTSATVTGGNSNRSHASFVSDGVTEKSNWADEVEESMDRTCQRLEQLAADEYTADPNTPLEEYYIRRLRRLLGNNKRQVPVTVGDLYGGRPES